MSDPKIILVCTDCVNTRILYNGIKDVIAIQHIITEQPVSKKKLIKRRIKKLGLFTVLSQLTFQALVVPLLRIISGNRVKEIIKDKNLSISALPSEIIISIDSVNEKEFVAAVNTISPDLILVNGTRIIAGKALAAINCPVINVHVGITPLYRGVHGGYWALVNEDSNHCGVTIHSIDKGIDTGDILAQGLISVEKKDNFITYPYLQFNKAIELLKETVPALLKNGLTFLPPPKGKSRLWSHPTIWQYFYYRMKGIK